MNQERYCHLRHTPGSLGERKACGPVLGVLGTLQARQVAGRCQRSRWGPLSLSCSPRGQLGWALLGAARQCSSGGGFCCSLTHMTIMASFLTLCAGCVEGFAFRASLPTVWGVTTVRAPVISCNRTNPFPHRSLISLLASFLSSDSVAPVSGLAAETTHCSIGTKAPAFISSAISYQRFQICDVFEEGLGCAPLLKVSIFEPCKHDMVNGLLQVGDIDVASAPTFL